MLQTPVQQQRDDVCSRALQVSQEAFLQAADASSLGVLFPTSSQHSLSLSELRQMQGYYSTVLGQAIACFEGLEINLSDKHNIIVISNEYSRQ